MAGYRTYGSRDDKSVDLGDAGFVGVNSRQAAGLLSPGIASHAINKDFMQGVAETRRGFRTCVWGERAGMNFPVDFPYDFDVRLGFRNVYGAGVFSDPNSQEGGLIACPRGAYRIAANELPAYIRYPLGTTVAGRIRFLQTFDRVLMLRGEENETLVWNPQQDFTAGYGEWQTVTQSDTRNTDADNSYGDGTVAVPNSAHGCVCGNRVLLIRGRDEVVISDILDYTRYNEATQRFRINRGSDDHLQRLFPVNKQTVIAFKDQSIRLLQNVTGDLSEVSADILSTEIGLFAPDAVFLAGSDIGFLSEGGIYTIGQTINNEYQMNEDALSGPIEPYMQRINWPYAQNSLAVTHGTKTYVAVPMDGAKYNNTILVYDWLNKQWAGYWQSAFLDVLSFIKLDRMNKKRLFAVNGFNLTDIPAMGALYEIGSGFTDNLYGTETSISDLLLTRGYTAGVMADKTFKNVVADIATWNPTYTIKAFADGVNEETTLADAKTKDRTKYYVWSWPDYDVTNVNDDHGRKSREDYSVFLDAAGIYAGTNGFDPSLHQRIQEPANLDVKAQFIQLEISNTQGRCNVHAAGVEVAAGERDDEEKV